MSKEKFTLLAGDSDGGLLLRAALAEKIEVLVEAHLKDLRSIVASNLDEVELCEWGLAYPDGKQTVVRWFNSSTHIKSHGLNQALDVRKTKQVEAYPATDKNNAVQKFFKDILGDAACPTCNTRPGDDTAAVAS